MIKWAGKKFPIVLIGKKEKPPAAESSPSAASPLVAPVPSVVDKEKDEKPNEPPPQTQIEPVKEVAQNEALERADKKIAELNEILVPLEKRLKNSPKPSESLGWSTGESKDEDKRIP